MSGALQSVFANFRSSAAPSFVSLITTPDPGGKGVASDSANNVIIVNGYSIQKFDSSGVLIWAKVAATDGYMVSVAVDSSDNIYAAGYLNSNIGFIIKFNSSGTIQWQKTQTPAASAWYARSILWQSIAVDSSNNIYVGGTWFNNNQAYGCCCGTPFPYKYEFGYLAIAKYNSSGTLQWANKFGGVAANTGMSPNAELFGYGVCVDASGNAIVSGSSRISTSGTQAMVVLKYNTSGTYQWGYAYKNDSSTLANQGIVAADSSDNIYVVSKSGYQQCFIKINSSGTFQWGKNIFAEHLNSITFDRTNNYLYIGGDYRYSTGAQADDYLIAKIDTSGALQFARTLGFQGSAGRDETAYGLAISSDNKIVFDGITYKDNTSTSSNLFGRIPTDGSKTGTYTLSGKSMTYASVSPTYTAQTFTRTLAVSTGFSDSENSSLTYTDAASSLTFNSQTPTYNTQVL